jgi:hypothetical protein
VKRDEQLALTRRVIELLEANHARLNDVCEALERHGAIIVDTAQTVEKTHRSVGRHNKDAANRWEAMKRVIRDLLAGRTE